MKEFFKTIIKSFGFSLLTLFFLNVIIFIATISESQITQGWTFNIELGTFLIDNIPSGFEFGKIETKGLLLLLFVLGLFMKFKSKDEIPQGIPVSSENI
jgi:membrane-associated phospholipid phosphatase